MHENLLFCVVANTNQFGNNFYVSPDSDVTDGKVEIVLVEKPKMKKMLKLLLVSFLKKVNKSELVKTFSVEKSSLIIHDTHGHIDGDPIICDYNELTIKVIPKSLKIIV